MRNVLLEGLETRRLMASVGPKVEFDARDGELEIKGTAAADTLAIAVNGTDATKLDVTLNGVTKQFPVAQVKEIEADLGAGNDSATVNANVSLGVELKGGDGDDTLVGGSGVDEIDGGSGVNTLTGGAGADHFKVVAADTITDFVAGVDTQKLTVPKPPKPVPPPPPAPSPVKLSGTQLKINGTSGNDTLTVAPNVDPTKLDVTLNGVTTTFSTTKIKRIDADLGAGNDTAVVNAAVTVAAKLSGGAGDDNLTGGAGADELDGGSGVNVLTGGAGADKFKGAVTTTVTDFVAGVDKKEIPTGVKPTPTPTPVPTPPGPVSLKNGEVKIQGTAGADTVAVAVNVDPTKLDVTLNGVTTQFSLALVKSIKAELGAGNDAATVNANVFVPVKLDGGAGDDTLVGGSGADKIEDELGTNTVTGGAGADQFEVNATTTITDFVVGVDRREDDEDEDEHDDDDDDAGGTTGGVKLKNGELKIEGTINADNLLVAPNATDATKLDVTLNGVTTSFLASQVRLIKAELGAGNDVAVINAAVLTPAKLEGGAGDDQLTGGGGNDKIEDESGTNTVTGGAGADTFEVNATTTITDFLAGTDKKEIGQHDEGDDD